MYVFTVSYFKDKFRNPKMIKASLKKNLKATSLTNAQINIQETIERIWCGLLLIEKVELNDDFFSLGGNSLLVVKAIAKIRSVFELDIPHNILFIHPTFSELCEWLSKRIANKGRTLPSISTQRRKSKIPLSFEQQGLWFLYKALEEKSIYNIPLIFLLTGSLNQNLLQKALNRLFQRHESLRVSIKENEGVPELIINNHELPIHTVDLSTISPDTREQEFLNLANKEALTHFDLSKGPLIRASLINLGEEKTGLIINTHHIIFDGWSIEIFCRELSILYNAYLRDEEPYLPTLQMQYSDFVFWQKHWLEGETLKNNLSYWKENLEKARELNFPTDKKRPRIPTYQKGVCKSFISPDVLEKLHQFSQKEGVTLFVCLLAVFEVLLHRYTGENDIIIGTPFANRHHPRIEEVIGYFVNTLPIRVRIAGSMSFIDLLHHVRNVTISAYENQDLPFEKLVDHLNIPRDINKNPLFQIAFGSNKGRDNTELNLNGIQDKLFVLEDGFSHFDIILNVYEEEGLHLVCEYAKDLFEESTIIRLLKHFETLLEGVIRNPDQLIKDFSLLTEAERHQILIEWNDTKTDYLKDKTIHQLFEEQVRKKPNNIAVVSECEEFTYEQLNEEANQLAHHLKILGVGPDTLVGIALERSSKMIIGLLGILKAGAAYVPLDTAWPVFRKKEILLSLDISYILTDLSQLKTIQTIQWSLPQLRHIVCLDALNLKPPPEEAEWEKIKAEWDYIAESAQDDITAADFISSYTGQPFSREEVNEYKDHVIKLALPYINANSRILEIGCGSGLIMFSLAPYASYYVGLDPSEVTQKRNKFYIDENHFNNIKLISGFAHDISLIKEEKFDLIILASTIQFYPGYQYVTNVIEESLKLLKTNGVILIADIMDIRQKDDFHSSLEKFRRENNNNKNLRTKIFLERELYFDENFFNDLKFDYQTITSISINYRRDDFSNELRYRYDVIIKKGAGTNEQLHAALLDERKKNLWTSWHIRKYPKFNVVSGVEPTNIAYIIHTSGSSGKPKGVVIQHQPAVNLISWVNNTFRVNSKDKILFLTSICFDLSVYDIFGLLAAGGTIRIALKTEIQDPAKLLQILRYEGITFWDSAPAVLNQLAHSIAIDDPIDKCEHLRLVFLSGDWIPVDLPEHLKRKITNGEIISLGGATEATIWSNYYPILKTNPNWTSIPYGKPIQNAKYYILDQYLSPCPIGVTGDLYIGGECLAVGYRNASEEDHARFIPNPLRSEKDIATDQNFRLYKTGDLARYFPDGNIEFLGRVDQQIKIRGFRVELEEIETILQSHGNVAQAVVLARSDTTDNKTLVAYVVQKQDAVDVSSASKGIFNWQSIYNDIYKDAKNAKNTTFNTIGWNSSYTDTPLPEIEMLEWVENAVNQILSLKPKRVLEVGCGTGLLLSRIAPHCQAYWGTDFSEEVIKHLNVLKEEITSLKHVELLKREASNFEGIKEGYFDVIILNSVIQYFPNTNYLKEVLQRAGQSLRKGGIIFIGDVRNLSLLKAYASSVEFFKASENKTKTHIKMHVNQRLNQEKELLIHPHFFTALQGELKEIKHLRIQPKRGKYNNELTKFRYDVFLYMDQQIHTQQIHTQQIDWVDWKDTDHSLTRIEEYLIKKSPNSYGLQNVHNERLHNEKEIINWLSKEEEELLKDFNIVPPSSTSKGINPEDLWQLGKRLGYKVEISWCNAYEDGAYDVAFIKEDSNIIGALINFPRNALGSKPTIYANNPFQKIENVERSSHLQEYLQQFLPDYMVPSFFVYVDKIPLTPNGKVDRKALPAPDLSLRLVGEEYVAPRTSLEEELCSIWKDVLKVEKIGIHDNFFKLGGHSLLATQVISRVRHTYNIDIPLRSLFEQPTVAALSEIVESLCQEDKVASLPPLVPIERKEPLPLSFAQQRLWFLDQLLPGLALYNIPLALRLKGPLDTQALEKSLNALIERHESLRTVFPSLEGEAHQEILPHLEIHLSECTIDLTSLRKEEQETSAQNLAEQEAMTLFKLSEDPLIRVKLLILGGDEHILLMTMHHIISDGWSMEVFFKELSQIYNAYTKGQEPTLSPLALQYADFALWQRAWLQGEALDRQLSYWKQQLAEIPDLLNLPTDKPRPKELSYQGGDYRFSLSKEIKDQLNQLAQDHQASLFMTLLTVFQILLYRYTGQKDIVVGTPIANRHYKEIEGLIGFFVNTLALRTLFEGEETFSGVLTKVKETTLQAYQHQDVPFEQLVDHLNIPRELNRNSVFQVMFTLQNSSKEEPLALDQLQVESFFNSYPIAKFDLYLRMNESEDELECGIEYAKDLFDAETIERMGAHFKKLVEEIVRNPNQDIATLSFLTKEEDRQLLIEWNDTKADYPIDKTLHQLFEEQVSKTPHNIAVVYDGAELTYQQLNERANQLAHHLRTLGVKPDTLVAIAVERSLEMVIGLLGILKAGGAYVPLDPTYPQERLQFMLEDINSSILITQSHLNEVFKDYSKTLLNLHLDNKTKELRIKERSFSGEASQTPKWITTASHSFQNLEPLTTPQNLAYVIYTSGSTGKPKGVMLAQENLIQYINYCREHYPMLEGSSLLHSSIAFDMSITSLFLPLTVGNPILILPQQSQVDSLESILKEHPTYFSFIKLTPTHLKALKNQLKPDSIYKQEGSLVVGGENLSRDDGRFWLEASPQSSLFNEYGPTETTVGCCVYKLEDYNILSSDSVPIGRPISNTQIYILDSQLNPVPIGVSGEIYIGGAGLARGYLNRPDLTAERFIPNPFVKDSHFHDESNTSASSSSGLPSEDLRLYRTGDLGRYLPDGNIEFLGRIDDQVKLRGFRIELGEIESVLQSHGDISQAVVIAREDDSDKGGSKKLVAYVVPADFTPSPTELREFLAEKLPEYMVPTFFVYLEKLPLTLNGKLDKKALPHPEYINEESYVPPRNELEKQVCHIWAEVLNLPQEKVGIRDDFFRLGGDSIVSIQLLSRLRQKLGLNISIKDIFTYKTIERLYDQVLSKSLSTDDKIEVKTEQGILNGEVPLLPIQEWFFESQAPEPNYWNQSFLIKTPNLNLERLKISLERLIEYHDNFRLKYKKDNGLQNIKNSSVHYIQYYDESAKNEELKILDIRTLKAEEGSQEFEDKLHEVLTQWQNGFDLEHSPLYSMGYIYGYCDGSARLHFALHHLIVDTVSWRILANDLKDLYHQKELGPKGSSYRQWVEAVEEYANSHKSEKLYWVNVLEDYNSEKINSLIASESTQNYIHLSLDRDQTKQLLRESNKAYHTHVNDILLTALGYTLSELTDEQVNHIVLEGHGREEIDSSINITKTSGWFTTLYPVRLEIKPKLEESLKHIKETLREVPHKGIGYGPLIGYGEQPLPRISFNYLGQFDEREDSKDSRLWSIVEEKSGRSIHSANQGYHILNINGLVINGKLQFGIASQLNEKMTATLAESFKRKLEEIISHTANQPRSYITASDVDNIISQRYLDNLQENREIESVYLANSLQQGFIYHALNQGDIDDAYRVQLIWQYNNRLDIDSLKEAWSYAQKRYPSLRLRLAWEEELVQVIDKTGHVDWRYIDLSNEPDLATQEFKLKQIQEEDRHEPYNLAHGNLFRIYIIKRQEALYTCIFSNHHAILDGWSNPILLDYVHDTYLKLCNKDIIPVLVDYSYRDAQKYLQEHESINKAYWETYLSQIEERGDLRSLVKLSKQDIKVSEYRHIIEPTEETLTIEGNLYETLKSLSQTSGITLNAILQYAWHKLLNIYGNAAQTVVGTTLSGRNLPINAIENSVGLYINTLPLIVNHQQTISKSILEGIRDIQDNINEINSRSNISLSKIQKHGERLFDSLFVYENYPTPTHKESQKSLNVSFKEAIEKVDYPLGVIAYEGKNKLIFILKYAGELISQEMIGQVLSLLKVLLEQIARDPHQQAQNLSYLSAEQYQQIIHTWNKTEKDYPEQKTIYELFEEQVEKAPDNIAVTYNDTKLTYRQLNEKANQLAHYIRERYEIKPDTLIALCLDRSEHVLIGILAVLKAGGAYVPMDPSYPDDRIKYILEDTNTQIVLTNEIYKERLESISKAKLRDKEAQQPLTILAMDDPALRDKLDIQPFTNPKTSTTSHHLAYVIYTSGTIGKPKGVMVEHKEVINYILNIQTHLSLSFEDKVDFSTNIGFDLTVTTTICSLCCGSQVVVYARELQNLEAYKYHLIENNITLLKLVPSYFELVMEFLPSSRINKLILGGEKLNYSSIEKLYKLHKNIYNLAIYDEYGPTEATVGTCNSRISLNNNLTIGKPYANYKTYVLDQALSPLPVGAIGELYIGGAGLARGYLNRSDLTAERFIPNPFQTEEEKNQRRSSRLYKTGDLVRWLPDGNLEYVGRNDSQVKIRGFRIELGEIESVLQSHGDVSQAVVIAREDDSDKGGSKKLVAYVVPGDFTPSPTELREFLAEKLPEYMVPTFFVYLEKLPLTLNGKLDKKALPHPEYINEESYVPPRNELEKQVCHIWAEVLNLPQEKVGIRDDFFRLGGDSIVSIQLLSRLRQRLGLNISIKDIFTYKNIERLYDHVLSKNLSTDYEREIKTEQGILSGEVSLLPIQEWFFESNVVEPHYWNQSFLIRTPSLDLDRLKTSISKLIEYHDNFRLKYKKENELQGSRNSNAHYIQYYDESAKNEELKILDVRTLKAEEGSQEFEDKLHEVLTQWQNGFDLERGPLYSIGYIYGYQDGSARIHFALHHLIVDTVSWRLLVNDLKDLYHQKELGLKGSSYRQWVETVKEYANTHKSQKLYWVNILEDYNAEKINSLIASESTQTYANLSLSQDQTKQLLRDSNKTYHTQVNDILLTALGYALSELTNEQVNHIVLEGHGREEIDASINITKTSGWFTTLYPVRLEIKPDLGESLKHTKETLREIPHKGIGYGPLIGYREKLLPRISFNYLGQFDEREESKDSSFWSIVEEKSGRSIHPANQGYNIININGLVINGKLQFGIASKLNEKMTVTLAETFKQKLEEIIKYTVSQPRSYLTASDIDNIISQRYLDKLQESREVEGIYLANSLQQGFIYHALNQGDVDDAYRVQLIWQYNNPLDTNNLKEAWSHAQKRYASLRLRLTWEEELVQVIDKVGYVDWRYIDLSDEADPAMQELKLKQIQGKDRCEPYNLAQGNLFRIYLIKHQEVSYTCIFSNHHAILDGWSNPILLDYVHDIYLKLCNKETVPVLVDHSYGDAQKYLQEHENTNKEYWEKYISQIEERGDLSGLVKLSKRSIKVSDYRHITEPAEETLTIEGNLYESLKDLNQTSGVTLNAILQYAWHKILNVYSNAAQTVAGTTVSGRNLPINNIESSVGLYINTLPLIVNHQQIISRSIIESIKEIQDNINEINSRSNISLSKIQKRGERLFDSLFVYENYPTPTHKEKQNRLNICFKEAIEKVDYPLGIIAYEGKSQLIFILKYAGELFSKDTIEHLLSLIKVLLEQIAGNPYQETQNLSYLNADQYQQIIQTWNETEKDYPDQKTIHELFEEQVERAPDNIAIVYEETRLTYKELNERANQLAHYIRQSYEIKPDTLIALCLDRSEHVLIGILAVLKAGGAYVPMDSTYPDERIQYILEDTNTQIILTNKTHKERLESISNAKLMDAGAQQQLAILAIDHPTLQDELYAYPTTNPKTSTTSSHLAYVIYTSGTTGKPKGVMIEHKSFIATINCTQQLYFAGKQGIKTYSTTNYVFDIFGLEYGVPLLSGGIISIGTHEFNLLDCSGYDFIQMTPSLCDLKLDFLVNTSQLKIFVGGEKLVPALLNKTLNKFKNIINAYGPTETTIWSASKLYSSKRTQNLLCVSFGKPFNNETAYVLDRALMPLPTGAIGELYIGGVSLARGYLNRPDLTAERFIPNPFQTEEDRKHNKNSRLYKTGDLVRWLPDGDLEYIGRNDFQVKIRGHRIELTEIEGALLAYKGVRQSVVLVMGHKAGEGTSGSENKYLVGYYVSEKKLNEEKIHHYLQTKLPEYMVPTFFVHLERLPLTINGKLDMKAFPAPELISEESYVAPRNDLEKEMCHIWAQVLNLPEEKVGIHDDFFRLGGNSILAIKLFTKINTYYQSHLKISDIFICKNIELLSSEVFNSPHVHKNIVKLNNTDKKPNMFMIHPGTGGCEVYTSLASALASNFSCYGVDSYNLYHEEKIDILHDLSKYYLTYIDKIMVKTDQRIYHLLGWSLGGQIALEIASILEKREDVKVKVYLLDTILNDDFILLSRKNSNIEHLKLNYKNYLIEQGYDKSHTEKIISNIEITNKLITQQISSPLTTTQVLLFKAMLEDTRFKDAIAQINYEYLRSKDYNNVDKALKNNANITLVKLYNAHHGNILEQEDLLVQEILSWHNDAWIKPGREMSQENHIETPCWSRESA